jgi:ribosomal protein S12 methylthiotransferase accessory factor YcaO
MLPLKNRLKHTSSTGASITRVRSVSDTLSEIEPLCIKIGVTRISEITFMDKLFIPNYSVTLPGTEDAVWVYNGKGITAPEAKASSLMEAIERYSSLHSSYSRSLIQGTYGELSKSYNKVLHPAEVVEPTKPEYDDKDPILDYLLGHDILNNEEVLVPAEIALYTYSPKPPAVRTFLHSHTNGLASGNVFEEAICHALCEIIERDAVSIADLCASSIPFTILESIRESLKKEGNSACADSRIHLEEIFVDDSSIFPDVDISEIAKGFDPINSLVRRFDDNRIPLSIKDITQKDMGIPTFVASSIEWLTHDYGYFAIGSGTHPDARIALIRAITEVSQTRAANIQGARDDLKKIMHKENDNIFKRKWQFMPSKRQHKINNIINFSDIKTYLYKDILQDINLILRCLKKAGLKRAIIVDLTNSNIGVPVVRAIVPGLETFGITQSIMGGRAKEFFKRITAQLIGNHH